MASTTGFDWGSLIGTGAGIGAALYGSNQAKNAINEGQQAQQGFASTAQQNLAPYSALGPYAIARMTGGINLKQLPGYNEGLAQGEEGINRGLAARGQFGSGGALKSLAKYNQDYASTKYGEEWNRLGSLLSSGQNADNAISGINQNLGNSAAAAALQRGNASSAGTNGVGSALSSYLGSNSGQNAVNGLASSVGGAVSGAGNTIGDLWNQYFGNGYAADGSTNGGYTGTGNTVNSLVGNGGYNGSGGSDYWSAYTPNPDTNNTQFNEWDM